MNAEGGLPVPQRHWAALALLLGLVLAVLDSAIANVALPTISRALGVSAADSILIVNAYLLVITVSMLPLAALGERIGFHRVYLSGLALFTVASIGCAMADSLLSLTLARVIQGFGAAAIISMNSALMRTIYPTGKLGQGISLNTAVMAIASVTGPSVASAVLSFAQWPWLFLINLPVGALALAVGLKALPRMAGHGRPYDLTSALMCAVTLGLAIAGVDAIGRDTQLLWVALTLAVALVCGWFFVKRQLTQATPLLPLDLLKIPVFSLSIGTSFSTCVAQGLTFVSLPFLMHSAWGMSALQIGPLMMPWPLAIVFTAPLAGYLSDRYSAMLMCSIGLLLLTSGLLLMATVGAHPAAADIAWRMAICGAGIGFFQAPNARQVLTSVPRQRSAGASAMQSIARFSGQSFGAALVGLLFGLSSETSTTPVLLAAGFAAVSAVLSLSRGLGLKAGMPEVKVD
ncbi:MFS transporter [Pseudomonas sp. NA-150]|uniref:MFS transporter n=1 Tax=Pseudomonas sp. NA-150 TaxID=3367525 RepID=UPI0037C9B913